MLVICRIWVLKVLNSNIKLLGFESTQQGRIMMYISAPQTHPREGERATNCFGFEEVNLDRFFGGFFEATQRKTT